MVFAGSHNKLFVIWIVASISAIAYLKNEEEFFPSFHETGRRLTTTSKSGGIHFLEHVSSATNALTVRLDKDTGKSNWYCEDGSLLPDPIVVVGTDGSGTRVVAKFLSMLGTTVLVERSVQSQMDVDGQIAGVSLSFF
jgi:hypothetical protein